MTEYWEKTKLSNSYYDRRLLDIQFYRHASNSDTVKPHVQKPRI